MISCEPSWEPIVRAMISQEDYRTAERQWTNNRVIGKVAGEWRQARSVVEEVVDNKVDRRAGKRRSCYRKITALRDDSRRNREKWRVLRFRNERHRRHCSLDSIDIQFAKVAVRLALVAATFFSLT